MTTKRIVLGDIEIGGGAPLVFIAGPCVIESAEHCLRMARELSAIARTAGIPLIFKASYDKANRSSADSYRGPGLEEGLEILRRVKKETGLPVLTDVHRFEQIAPVARVADVLQVPAFLSRQTDFIAEVAASGRVVNIKKGQFLAPWDMQNVIAKATGAGNDRIILTERGASFGYNNLVADMRSLVVMRRFGYPVVFDATHSVQLPGGEGSRSGGQREFVLPLARAAVAVGIDGLFTEVHDCPESALCDGPNSLDLEAFRTLIGQAHSLSSATGTSNENQSSFPGRSVQ